MGTTIEDIQYEEHLESLHKSYISALEKFARAKNLKELKENLEELQGARASAEDWMTTVKSGELNFLEKQLAEISTIDEVYKMLISEREKSNKRFKTGTLLAISGLILTVVGVLLSVMSILLWK